MTSGHVSASRALPNLARAGVLITRHRFAEVAFEVHHLADRPGYLFGLHESASQDLCALQQAGVSVTGGAAGGSATKPFFETLSSAAYGAGLIVRTAVQSVVEGQPDQQGHLEAPRPDCQMQGASSWVFKSSAQPNPTFIYESRSALEGLVILDVEPRRLVISHGKAIHEIATEVAQLAVGSGSPLLYIQSPAQLPPQSYTPEDLAEREDDWARASSLVVRFSIAIGQRSSRERSDLARDLAEYCARRGWGLQLRDTRPEHRSGNWFAVVSHDAERSRAYVDGLSSRNQRAVNWMCPVTIVGPARVGSTLSVLRLLGAYNPASVVGISVASLDDLAFIHLLLALPESTREALGHAREGLTGWAVLGQGAPVGSAFAALMESLGMRDRALGVDSCLAEVWERAGDYKLFAGPVVSTRVKDVPARPLWMSWELERTVDGLHVPLTSLSAALSRLGLTNKNTQGHGGNVNVEYLVCRDVGDATLRAKGKLSVPDEVWRRVLPTYKRPAAGRRLAKLLEESWQAQLERSTRARGDLAVAWREAWLSRSPIGA